MSSKVTSSPFFFFDAVLANCQRRHDRRDLVGDLLLDQVGVLGDALVAVALGRVLHR